MTPPAVLLERVLDHLLVVVRTPAPHNHSSGRAGHVQAVKMDQELIGFVAEPNCGRGTTGIIWNCVVTIILCTWVRLRSSCTRCLCRHGRVRVF